MKNMRVAVIGATGVAGQQFLAALAGHPYFEVAALAASERSAGKRYREAITDTPGAFRWYCPEPLDPAFAEKFLNFIISEVIRHHQAIAENHDSAADPVQEPSSGR